MRKLIKVFVYLDTDEGDKMNKLVADVKSEILRLNELWKKFGLHTIKVTTNGFDAFRGRWGLETELKKKR
ncbi:hypothetical protein KAW18_11025 [candidate division WOR-3 bacterium]|nr:hypothetical protein [candidate division WOR-3 bacterium]